MCIPDECENMLYECMNMLDECDNMPDECKYARWV